MKLRNRKVAGMLIKTAKGEAQFDANGIADVSDEIGSTLLELAGYETADGETPVAEAPKKADKEEKPVESPVVDEKAEEEADKAVEDTTTDNLEEELGKMNYPQLKKYAKENNIDLGDASKKDEIIAIILGASV